MLAAGTDEVERGDAGAATALPRGAWGAFAVLFAMNLLDYMDRNILYAVLKQVKLDLDISDVKAGALATYFLVSYSLVSPLMGWLGDRWRRNRLLFVGVGVWSLATVGTGLARDYGQLVLARCLLGVGEATYGVIAPTILLDLFPKRARSRVLSAFYLAMPLGSALGMGLGGTLAKRLAGGWHSAFFVVGAPGLLAAFAALLLPEPVRGATEGVGLEGLRAQERAGASRRDYLDLIVNSSYTYAVFGMAAYTFAIGGMLVWFPSFLTATRGIEQERAVWALGLTTLVAAVTGMGLGGWVADRWAKTNPRALFLVPGLAMLASIPFILLGLFAQRPAWIFAGILGAETLMFVNTGPCNAVIANVVAPNLRAAAYAICVLLIHFLGDILSPPLMGWVSDSFSGPVGMATPIGHALAAIGAVPTLGPEAGARPQNLLAGLLLAVPAVFVAGVVLLAGARHLPREMALMLVRLKVLESAPQGSRSEE